MFRVIMLVLGRHAHAEYFDEQVFSVMEEAYAFAVELVALALSEEAWVQVRVHHGAFGTCHDKAIVETGCMAEPYIHDARMSHEHAPGTAVAQTDKKYVYYRYYCPTCGAETAA